MTKKVKKMSFENSMYFNEKKVIWSPWSKKRGFWASFSFFVHKCQHHFSKMRLIRETEKMGDLLQRSSVLYTKGKKGVNQKFKMEFEDKKVKAVVWEKKTLGSL